MGYDGIPFGWASAAPPGYTFDRLGRCSSCAAEIAWCWTPKGNRAPMNADGISHFATCPNAAEHRRPKKPTPGLLGDDPIISRKAPEPLRDATDEAIEHGDSASGSVEWRTVAKEVLFDLCATRETLTSDHFWHAMDLRWSRPSEPRWLGSVMQHARRQGWLEPTGERVQTQRRETAGGARHHSTDIPLLRSLIYRTGGTR